MSALGLALGLPVAGLAAVVVYADAARRELPSAARLRWAGDVAAVSAAGFLAAFAFDGVIYRAYAAVAGTPVVVTAPYQHVATLFAVGLVVSAGAVLAYGFGSRRGQFDAA